MLTAAVVIGLAPVVAFTAGSIPWRWAFVLTYVLAAFVLQALVRLTHAGLERFIHILVLAGGAPIVSRWFFGELTTSSMVHVGATMAMSIGFGYLLADLVRVRHR
jgi:hypothetical protein